MDLIVRGALRAVGGRVALIPWVMFAITAVLTAIGAVSPAACAIIGPIALGFAGRYRIMYFGFTHCPDVCPTDLAVIGQALRRFEKSDPARAARVAPIFVSVDPERDSPAVLKANFLRTKRFEGSSR